MQKIGGTWEKRQGNFFCVPVAVALVAGHWAEEDRPEGREMAVHRDDDRVGCVRIGEYRLVAGGGG